MVRVLTTTLCLVSLFALMLGVSQCQAAEQAPRPPQAPTPPEEASEPLSYVDAHAKSLKTGKPLVVWVGGNFCARCVAGTNDEFCHTFVDRFDGATAPAIVVGVPSGEHVIRIATITRWVEGDAGLGHTATVRKAVTLWRDQRQSAAYGQLGWGEPARTAGVGGFYRAAPAYQPARRGVSSGRCGPGG